MSDVPPLGENLPPKESQPKLQSPNSVYAHDKPSSLKKPRNNRYNVEQSNGKATASMALGIAGLFICFLAVLSRNIFFGFILGGLFGIISIFLGIFGWRKAKENGGMGYHRALIGIIIGVLILLVATILISLFSYGWSKYGESTGSNNSAEEIFKEGTAADTNDYKISDEKVDVSENYDYGVENGGPYIQRLVSFQAKIKNTSDKTQTFVLEIKCIGDHGDLEKDYDKVGNLDPKMSKFVSALVWMDKNTLSADCKISNVKRTTNKTNL